ncbi:hypothetical protein BLNAU_7144 [Blattamonas nauphoetae]|uniref:Uncharacterized protein n=1 Tax=Blattamonas nauphoetae TaxID=2049346 RepID=A0ABQ9Y2P9_9EUKA|nr:hypothetical protein BLNAU_7144 [Blattamonas nauphoetae]
MSSEISELYPSYFLQKSSTFNESAARSLLLSFDSFSQAEILPGPGSHRLQTVPQSPSLFVHFENRLLQHQNKFSEKMQQIDRNKQEYRQKLGPTGSNFMPLSTSYTNSLASFNTDELSSAISRALQMHFSAQTQSYYHHNQSNHHHKQKKPTPNVSEPTSDTDDSTSDDDRSPDLSSSLKDREHPKPQQNRQDREHRTHKSGPDSSQKRPEKKRTSKAVPTATLQHPVDPSHTRAMQPSELPPKENTRANKTVSKSQKPKPSKTQPSSPPPPPVKASTASLSRSSQKTVKMKPPFDETNPPPPPSEPSSPARTNSAKYVSHTSQSPTQTLTKANIPLSKPSEPKTTTKPPLSLSAHPSFIQNSKHFPSTPLSTSTSNLDVVDPFVEEGDDTDPFNFASSSYARPGSVMSHSSNTLGRGPQKPSQSRPSSLRLRSYTPQARTQTATPVSSQSIMSVQERVELALKKNKKI